MRPQIHIEPVGHLDNDALTTLTLIRMNDLATADSQSPYLWTATEDALGYPPSGDPNESRIEVQRVFDWIRRNVKFVNDPYLVVGWLREWQDAVDCEVLTSPARLVTMQRMFGDCDDFAMLGKAMLRVCGIESLFVTVKADPANPDEWSHVYLDVLVGNDWVPFDPSYGKYVGWEAPNTWGRKVWSL